MKTDEVCDRPLDPFACTPMLQYGYAYFFILASQKYTNYNHFR